jgi:hypothetical protein
MLIRAHLSTSNGIGSFLLISNPSSSPPLIRSLLYRTILVCFSAADGGWQLIHVPCRRPLAPALNSTASRIQSSRLIPAVLLAQAVSS